MKLLSNLVDWRSKITELKKYKQPQGEVHTVARVEDTNLVNYAHDVRAVLMNPPWNLVKRHSNEPGVSFEEFVSTPKLISCSKS